MRFTADELLTIFCDEHVLVTRYDTDAGVVFAVAFNSGGTNYVVKIRGDADPSDPTLTKAHLFPDLGEDGETLELSPFLIPLP